MIGRTNTGGGGLSDSNAILRVTVPTGSAVTASKGGVTKFAKMWTQNADNTLDTAIIPIPAGSFDSNPWTVTATLGGDSDSDTVIIDSADEYDVLLSYNTYLYEYGTQVVPWSVNGQSNTSYSFEPTYILTNVTQSTNSHIAVFTTSKVDVTDYTVLTVEIEVNSIKLDGYKCYIGLSSSNTTRDPDSNWVASQLAPVNADVIQTITLDITSISGSYYVYASSGTASVKIHAVYLR